MNKLIYSIIIISLCAANLFAQQDTTISQAFKDAQPRRTAYFKAKYPSYSLLAGYLLVTEANRGDPFAQHELGLRYLTGQGFPPDTVKAIYWIRKAVDQNLPAARYNYGILLHNGIGVPWNPFEAFTNFKNASSAGLPDAQFAYGLLMTDNLTVNRNYGEAYNLFRRAAKGGFKPAKDALEQMEKSGFIPPADSSQDNFVKQEETVNLINQDWDLDFYNFDQYDKEEENVSNIDKILSKGSTELKKLFGLDEEKENIKLTDTSGIGILKFAAESGSPEAIFLFARIYENGIRFEKNLITAASNYLRAYRLGSFKAGESLFKLIQMESFVNALKESASKNNAEAMYVFASITALGFTNLINNQQALDLLKTAAVKNHIPSIIELGICYSSGTLVDKDINQAIKYWDIAKNLGSREAEIRIAFSGLADTTVASDYTNHIQILNKAVDEGSVLAQTFLGYCYEKGLGVKENKAKAVLLYKRAAQRGNQTAYNSLKRLYDEIRPMEEQFKIYETD